MKLNIQLKKKQKQKQKHEIFFYITNLAATQNCVLNATVDGAVALLVSQIGRNRGIPMRDWRKAIDAGLGMRRRSCLFVMLYRTVNIYHRDM